MSDSSVRTLVIAVHDGTDKLACVHMAESDDELMEVVAAAAALGPVWTFEVHDNQPLQEWLT